MTRVSRGRWERRMQETAQRNSQAMVEQLRLGMRRRVSDGLAALFMRCRSNGGDTEAERTTRWKGGPSCSVGEVIVDDV
jgi:hypothetical protein